MADYTEVTIDGQLYRQYSDSPIRWNGSTEDGRTADNIVWGSNSYTWDDIQFAGELIRAAQPGGHSYAGRKRLFDQWLKTKPEKKKHLIRLICRIKGIKIYDETKVDISDIKVTLEDADLVIKEVLGPKALTLECDVNGKIYKETKEVGAYYGI